MNDVVREERIENLLVRVIELGRCDDPDCVPCSLRPDWFYFWITPEGRDRWMCIADASTSEHSPDLDGQEIALFERLCIGWGVEWERIEEFDNNDLTEAGMVYEHLIEGISDERAKSIATQSIKQIERFREAARLMLDRREAAPWN